MRTRTPLLRIVFALLLAVAGVRMSAQPPPPPPPAPGTPGAAPASDAALADKPASDAAADAAKAAAAATKSKDASGHDTLSVDFPDEDIRSILRNVADLFELNLAMPDSLQGKTTIKLRDVTWRQIFQTVLAPVNYTYIEDGNIIKIVSNESLTQEPVSTEVFIINNAKASDILPTITSLVDAAGGGKIVVDARSNALVITERPSRMNRIRPIIETLDKATDQVMIESKFVEVTNSDVKNLGVNWASLANYQLKAGGINSTVARNRGQSGGDSRDQSNNTTTSNQQGASNQTNNQTGTTQAAGTSNTGSVTSNTGAVTSTSTTGNTGNIDSTGSSSATGTTTGTVSNQINSALNLLNNLANTEATTRTFNAVFSANDFTLVLSALQQLQTTKIVSNPTIVTLNNTPAKINVGQERPIPSYTYNQQTGTYEVSNFTYKPIGVNLEVTPQVNARGVIKLTVVPEVSQSTRDAIFNGASIPIVETRKASTTVMLKDGYTMGIGGLMQSSNTNGTNKVPVLGNIPVIGRLFRSDTKNLDSTNLIIFITAKTVSSDGAPVELIFDSERVRGLQMKREELPGHRDGSDPFLPAGATEAKK